MTVDRIVEVERNGEWIRVAFECLKIGDLVRLSEETGEIVATGRVVKPAKAIKNENGVETWMFSYEDV